MSRLAFMPTISRYLTGEDLLLPSIATWWCGQQAERDHVAANIDKIYWDVAKNYGASQTVMLTRIVFFGALPTIFAGLRIALAVSFVVLVASEFVATKSGIGYLIWNSWELLQVDIMFVGIVTIGILGLITSVLFQEVERWAIPWKTE